jgi:hypothetical protein
MTPEEIAIFLRLIGTQQFVAETGEASAAVERLGVVTEEAGLAMARTTRRGFLMNQALFTIRRITYMTTLALVGSGLAAAKWGWDFNNAMQQARVALQPISGEIGGVQNELDYLFNFTKYTPFQFKDVTIAFRQMYLGMRTVGISADTVNTTLRAITDALAATGRTSPGALNRVAVALQHMAYMGHLTGQVVMQLARDGLPIYAALQKELHLTGEQIHNIGRLGIPAQVALDALNKYIESTPGLMNAAHRQAVSTFHGLFTTFRDNLSQIMGAVESGFFHHLQGRLVAMNSWFDRTSKTIKDTGGSATDVVRAIDPAAVPLWHQVADYVHLLWVNFSNLVGQLIHSRMLWATVFLGLLLLNGVLTVLVPLTQHFGWALNILIPLFVAWLALTKSLAFWQAVLDIRLAAGAKITKDLTFATFLAKAAEYAWITAIWLAYAIQLKWNEQTAISAALTYAWTAALYLASAAEYVYTAATTAAKDSIYLQYIWTRAVRIATWLWTATLYAVAVAEYVYAAAVGAAKDSLMLQFFWQKATTAASWLWIAALYAASVAEGVLAAAMDTEAVAAAAAWAATFLPITLIVAAIAGIAAAIYVVITRWRELKHELAGGIGADLVGGTGGGGHFTGGGILGNWLSAHTGAPGWLTGAHRIPGQAGGGTTVNPGLSWVGEHGPELMYMPAGATVTSHDQSRGVFNLMESWMKNQDSGRRGPLIFRLEVNRRVLGEVIAEEMAAQGARA